MSTFDYIASATRTITLERDALSDLANTINENFTKACTCIEACKGRVIVIGIGKSGHIGRKIAATLASTGCPAFFVHPSEASHGDFGMITKEDVVLAISSSGASPEVTTLLPLLKRLGVPIIALTGNENSVLSDASDIHLNISVKSEACPLNLAPTSSTTVTLALGDAIAVALLESRGFTAEDFAFSHPGGTLGRKLLLRVTDVMHAGKEIPTVNTDTPLREALSEMSTKGFGMTVVVDENNHTRGIFTDGDLRRCIDQGKDINAVCVGEVMTHNPRTVSTDTLAAEALRIMQEMKITALVVRNDSLEGNAGEPAQGILHMHDLLRAGIM